VFFQDTKKDVIYYPTIESNKELINVRKDNKGKRNDLGLARPPKSSRNDSNQNVTTYQDNEENMKITLKIPRLKSVNKSESKANKCLNKSFHEVLDGNNIIQLRRNSAITFESKIPEKLHSKKYNSNVINSRIMIESVFGTESIIKNLSPNIEKNANYISISSIDDNDISKGMVNENRDISPRGSYRSLISNDYLANNV
jgi:hypothetical protein